MLERIFLLARKRLAQRVELRIMGSKSELPRTLVAVSGARTVGFGVLRSVPKWRARYDSNARPLPSERG
jgi:site-specific DNA recombinase